MMSGDAEVRTFDDAVSAFGFLVDEFGFDRVSSTVRTPEHRIIFENGTTRVVVAFEIGGAAWVELGKLTAPGERRERYDLQFLLMERAPHEVTEISERPRHNDELMPSVRRLASVVREYAPDILRGDFSVFPRLRDRAEENFARTNADLYGG